MWVFQLTAGLGIASLLKIVISPQPFSRQLAITFITLALGGTLIIPRVNYAIFQSHQFTGDVRANKYKAVTQWLNEHTEPNESVAFIEIGYLGYFSQNRIIDLAGLIDPTITPHIATKGYTWGFWHYQPDYYIYNPDFNWALGEIDPLKAGYIKVYEIKTNDSTAPVAIFKRHDTQ
jgi:hypothetical protein